MRRSMTWLVGVVKGLLLTASAFGVLRLLDAKEGAERAKNQYLTVVSLADQIDALSNRQAVASSRHEGLHQLNAAIEMAATDAGIGKQQIGSIAAQDARRVGQTPYYRLPTRVTIEAVELPPLVNLLSRLTQGNRLTLEDCRLAAPHNEIVGKTWNAEFTLAYLIYDPGQDKNNP